MHNDQNDGNTVTKSETRTERMRGYGALCRLRTGTDAPISLTPQGLGWIFNVLWTDEDGDVLHEDLDDLVRGYRDCASGSAQQ